MRLSLRYQSRDGLKRTFRSDRLALDIVDYPGEWLLDLTLMEQDYKSWSKRCFEQAERALYRPYAKEWLSFVDGLEAMLENPEEGDEPVLEPSPEKRPATLPRISSEPKRPAGPTPF